MKANQFRSNSSMIQLNIEIDLRENAAEQKLKENIFDEFVVVMFFFINRTTETQREEGEKTKYLSIMEIKQLADQFN